MRSNQAGKPRQREVARLSRAPESAPATVPTKLDEVPCRDRRKAHKRHLPRQRETVYEIAFERRLDVPALCCSGKSGIQNAKREIARVTRDVSLLGHSEDRLFNSDARKKKFKPADENASRVRGGPDHGTTAPASLLIVDSDPLAD